MLSLWGKLFSWAAQASKRVIRNRSEELFPKERGTCGCSGQPGTWPDFLIQELRDIPLTAIY